MPRTRRPFRTVAVLLLAGWICSAEARQATDNVVIVLDASGSMGEYMGDSTQTRMQVARGALRTVLDSIENDTHVGLYVFSGAGRNDPWALPVGPVDTQRLQRAVQAIRPEGGTPLGASLKDGADRLLELRDDQHGYGTFRLLVVSDGEADDAGLVNAYLPSIVARGIVVDVIGVDMAEDHQLATRVHSYRQAHDAAALERAIGQVFAEIGSVDTDVVAEDAFEQIAPLPDRLAADLLTTLGRTDNAPIESGRTDGTSRTAPPPPAGSAGGFSFLYVVVFIVVVTGVAAARKAARS